MALAGDNVASRLLRSQRVTGATWKKTGRNERPFSPGISMPGNALVFTGCGREGMASVRQPGLRLIMDCRNYRNDPASDQVRDLRNHFINQAEWLPDPFN